MYKLANLSIDYSLFDYKEKDQFFTPSECANYCYLKLLEIIKKYNDNENGIHILSPLQERVVSNLPENRRIGLDIEPRLDEIKKQDFLEWTPSDNNKHIVLGNPPFGLRASSTEIYKSFK